MALGTATRGHVALVAGAFLVNGVASTVWLATTPALAERFGTTVGGLGVAFAAVALGGIVGTRVAPVAVARLGAGRTTVVAGFAIAALLAVRGLPTALAWFVVAQFAAGVADGVQDVAMNVEAVAVDSHRPVPIVNRLHAVWSIGAVIGGVLGTVLAAADASVPAHFAAGAVVTAVLATALLPLRRSTVVAAPADAGGDAPELLRWWHSRPLVVLALMGIACSLLEGAPLDWGTLYVADELGGSPTAAAAVAVTYTTGMVVSRLVADHLVLRLGAPVVLRLGTAAAAVALTVSLAVDRTPVALVAWAVMGAGVAVAYPALFVAAGRAPGVPAGTGIGAVASVARTGFLLGPVLIGAVADAAGLRAALTIPLAAAVVVIALAGAARRPPPTIGP